MLGSVVNEVCSNKKLGLVAYENFRNSSIIHKEKTKEINL